MAKGTDVLSLPAAAAPEELLAFQTALSTFGPSKRLIEVLKELGEGALDDLIIALAEGKLSDAVATKLKVNPTLLPPFLKKAQELLALCTKSREPEAYQPFVPPAPEAPVKDVIAIVRAVRTRLGDAQALSFLSFEEAVEGIDCSRIRQAAFWLLGVPNQQIQSCEEL